MRDFNRFSLDLAKYFQGRKSEAKRFRRAVHEAFSGVQRYTPTGQNSFEEFIENWTDKPLGLELANVLASYGQGKGDIKYGITLYYVALTHPDFEAVLDMLEAIFLPGKTLEDIDVSSPRVRLSSMAPSPEIRTDYQTGDTQINTDQVEDDVEVCVSAPKGTTISVFVRVLKRRKPEYFNEDNSGIKINIHVDSSVRGSDGFPAVRELWLNVPSRSHWRQSLLETLTELALEVRADDGQSNIIVRYS